MIIYFYSANVSTTTIAAPLIVALGSVATYIHKIEVK